MDADRVAEFALRELDRKIPREAPKPKSREPRNWATATDADFTRELRNLGVTSH
jgi:hypothetical protein